MTLNPKKSSVVFSLLCSWLAIIAAACVPLWEVSVVEFVYVLTEESQRTVLRTGPLWEVVREEYLVSHLGVATKLKFAYPPSLEPKDGFIVRQRNNIIALFLVCIAGVGIGRFTHWRLWERSCVA